MVHKIGHDRITKVVAAVGLSAYLTALSPVSAENTGKNALVLLIGQDRIAEC